MVRCTLVSIVQQPDIANRSDLVVWHCEEWLEVFSILDNVGQPDHGWVVLLGACQELAAQFNLIGVSNFVGFYN